MTPEQKIAKAKTLIIEATQAIRKREKAATAAESCQCGHRRDQHTVTYSVNYTGGFCIVKGCANQCKWFMQEAS